MTQLVAIAPLLVALAAWTRATGTIFTPSGVLLGSWVVALAAHAVLAPEFRFSFTAAILIVVFLASFLCGEWLVRTTRAVHRLPRQELARVLADRYGDAFELRLRLATLAIGVLSLGGSFAYLAVFVNHFGSLAALLAAGWLIRAEIGSQALTVPLAVRAVALLSYSGLSLALIYWIRFRFRSFLVLPFASILVMGIAQAGRAGTLIALIWAFLASYWKDSFGGREQIGARFVRRFAVFFGVMTAIFLAGLMYRQQDFSLDLVDFRQLDELRVYALGAISGFSAFLDGSTGAPPAWGVNTFASLADLLGIRAVPFGFYDEYLNITSGGYEHTNVYTMFRPLIDDFGFVGAAACMFGLGAVACALYRKAVTGSLSALSALVGFYSMFVFSTITPMSQHNSFIVAFLLPPLVVAWAERGHARELDACRA